MKKTKKVLPIILAIVLALTLLAGCTQPNETPPKGTDTPATQSPSNTDAPDETDDMSEEVTLSLVFGEHSTQLYHEDTWLIAPWAKENFNVNLEITAIPASDWETKRNTIIAGQDIPDLMMGIGRDVANEYGSKGLFLNLYDYMDNMPDMKKAMDEFPLLKTWMYYSDTEIYSQATTIATEGAVNQTAYYVPFIRRDIMTELGINDMPKTFDDLHNILKAMKEKYPDSYPWINRMTLALTVNVFAPGLGIDVAPMSKSGTGWAVWNEDSKEFTSIMEEENFKWFLSWMNQLYDEALLDPNYAQDDTSTWQDKLITGQGFFTCDYFSRPDTMTVGGKAVNPDYVLEAMMTPALDGGQQKIFADVGIGGANAFSAKTEHPERLTAMLNDWYYTEEGCLLMTYGIEDVTFKKNDDGTLSKIYSDVAPSSLDFDAAYGVNYLTFWGFKPDFFGYDLFDPDQSDVYNHTWNLNKDKMISLPPTIIFNTEEQEEYAEFGADLSTTLLNVFNEFIIGRRDIDNDWDAAKAELEAAGYNDHLELLNSAYGRLNK